MRLPPRVFAAVSLGVAFGVMPLVGTMAAGTALALGSSAPSPSVCATNREDPGAVAIASAVHPPPAVRAKAVAVISRSTGQVLYELQGRQRLAPASTTKVMTAIVALESIADEGHSVITETDASSMTGSSVMGLWPAATVTYRDLLFGLMLPSGNDAALELARHLGPTEPEFVARMNSKALQLGLTDTHFSNPHGLDAHDHYSSAIDLALLGAYAMSNGRFREIAATTDHQLSTPFDYAIHNGNSILGTYAGATGIKIGWTDKAGWTFVASAARDGEEVVVALLDTTDRDADAKAVLDWAFEGHTWRAIDASMLRMLETLGALSGVNLVERFVARCAEQFDPA